MEALADAQIAVTHDCRCLYFPYEITECSCDVKLRILGFYLEIEVKKPLS